MSLSYDSTRLWLQIIIERQNIYASIAQRNGCYTPLGTDSLPDTSGSDPAQHFDTGLSHWNHAFRGRGLGTKRARLPGDVAGSTDAAATTGGAAGAIAWQDHYFKRRAFCPDPDPGDTGWSRQKRPIPCGSPSSQRHAHVWSDPVPDHSGMASNANW